jgi:ketosteroid isomerase-like protein
MAITAHHIAIMASDHAAAWTRGDVVATTHMYAVGAQISVNGGAPHVGQQALQDSAQTLMDSFEKDLRVHVRETRFAQGRAIFVWVLEGTHKETGNRVVLPGWHEWTLDENGQVKECLGFYDASEMERQTAGS